MAKIDLLNEPREQFIESIGMIAQNEGMARIAGRVFGLLVFDKGPYSFSQIAEILKVSRGSISSSTRRLEELGLLERVAKPGDRQDYFQLAANPYETLFQGAAMRAAKAKATIERHASKVPKKSKDVRERLDAYAAFYSAFENSMKSAAKSI